MKAAVFFKGRKIKGLLNFFFFLGYFDKATISYYIKPWYMVYIFRKFLAKTFLLIMLILKCFIRSPHGVFEVAITKVTS